MSALPPTTPAGVVTATVRPRAARTPDIPAPRPPSDLARPAGIGTPGRPVEPAGTPSSGRHRCLPTTSRAERVLLVAGRAGSLTTLAALLVLSAALAGALDGSRPTGPAAEVSTTTLR